MILHDRLKHETPLKKVSMAAESATQDSRKRTLEALERRLAVAKAELLTQQKRDKKSIKEYGKQHTASITSTDSSSLLCGPPGTPPLVTSSKKGNFTFSGQATLQDSEEGGTTYAQLSQTVHENLLATNEEIMQFSAGRKSSINSILHELLQKGDSAPKYLQGSRSMKIDNWIHLDNLVQRCGASSGSHIRALRVNSKRSKKNMSMKQHKKHGTLDLPQKFHKFDTFRPTHELWKGYMQQLLTAAGKNQLAQCLVDADLHGAIILEATNVILALSTMAVFLSFEFHFLQLWCKVISFTGVCGIVIRETAETFGIISEDNKFQVVPKKISVFVFHVDCWKVTLHGDKLTSRKLGL
ncbi:ribonuclease MRP protein subunit POP4-like [Prosopis cineraria]|uniref:ribonuclease MRP protein subunit POP4-like n=1 Tax=Prosopis cineraria TaxID=364024 RepID=UPI00240F86A3|nr:ribonuclease MRP protein subunit POP4-like [Prosopis cineraria]